MKKHIIILTVLLSIGMYNTYGQVIVPREVTGLASDALSPIPGQPYTYSVNVPAPDGTKTYQWFVTQQLNFITARDGTVDLREVNGGDVLADGDINGTTGFYDGEELELTWKTYDFNIHEYVFVVIYVQNEDAEGCITDNMKVYRIEPQHAFTLDIANMGEGSDYGSNIDICADDVLSAEFNPSLGTNGEVEFTYGENILFYEIVAANFMDEYELFVQFRGLNTVQDVVIEWSRTSDFATATEITIDGSGDGSIVIPGAAGSGSVGADGEVIFVRAIITHNNFEGLSPIQYTLAINGFTGAELDMQEIYYATGETDGFENDIAYQTITPRPEITPVDPLEFVPDNAQ